MGIMNLQELIQFGFEGFPRSRMQWMEVEHLPNHLWCPDYDYDHVQRFFDGEVFEEVALRTWLCTDTTVGLYGILWNGVPIAVTYQGCRKGDRVWIFFNDLTEERMFRKFLEYRADEYVQSSKVGLSPDLLSMEFSPDKRYDWQTGPLYNINLTRE
ncbi:MAG: hypothetical protein WCY93_10715 [Anaerolineaceae bacterium]